jgi:hypothetical protein
VSESGAGPAPEPARPAARRGEVRVRRAPRYSRFLIVGAFAGVLAALVLTSTFPISEDFGFGPTFVVLTLFLVPAGMVLGTVVALVLDRSLSRRGRTLGIEDDGAGRDDTGGDDTGGAAAAGGDPQPGPADRR